MACGHRARAPGPCTYVTVLPTTARRIARTAGRSAAYLVGAHPTGWCGLRPSDPIRLEPSMIRVRGTARFDTPASWWVTSMWAEDELTLWELAAYKARPSWQAVRHSTIHPGVSVNDFIAGQYKDHASSFTTAVAVAASYLGAPVTLTGRGVDVDTIAAGGPCDGILEPGDRIRRANNCDVSHIGDLVDVVSRTGPGGAIALVIDRNDTRTGVPVAVTVTVAPDGRPPLGIDVHNVDPRFDVPFDVTFDSGSGMGPSAGLVSALAAIDVVTPGCLAGGHQVAVTGAVAVDGSVLPVGGVDLKAASLRGQAIDTFIVPAGQGPEAHSRAPRHVEVVEVDSVEAAVACCIESLGGDTPTLPRRRP